MFSAIFSGIYFRIFFSTKTSKYMHFKLFYRLINTFIYIFYHSRSAWTMDRQALTTGAVDLYIHTRPLPRAINPPKVVTIV